MLLDGKILAIVGDLTDDIMVMAQGRVVPKNIFNFITAFGD